MQLQENNIFDNRYHLKKLLGCGGFSEVWLVEDARIGSKKMALKVYIPGKGLDEDGVQLFSSEFELVFDLNHHHLLRPTHFDLCENSPYLIMPYCEKGSANKLIGTITEEDAWRFIHDVSAGLAYLHAQAPPIIHQDIKPDNVLIDNQGHYLITDFGISTKARNTLRKSVGDTKTNAGTPAYMGPERFGKDNAAIKASDIWALGVTTYELLEGRLPFPQGLGGLAQKGGAEIPEISNNYSQNLKNLVYKMLAKDTWDRPEAEKIVEWTEQYLKEEKITFSSSTPNGRDVERNVSTSSPKHKSPRKKIIWTIAGGTLLLVAAFIAIVIKWEPKQESDKQEVGLEEQAGEESEKQMEDRVEKQAEEKMVTDTDIRVIDNEKTVQVVQVDTQRIENNVAPTPIKETERTYGKKIVEDLDTSVLQLLQALANAQLYFDLDSDVPKQPKEAQLEVDRAATILKNNPKLKIIVSIYGVETDKQDNDLNKRRANRIRDMFKGLDSKQIETKSFSFEDYPKDKFNDFESSTVCFKITKYD